MDDTQKIVNVIVAHSARYAMSKYETEHLVEMIAREFDAQDWASLKKAVLSRLQTDGE